MTTVQIHRHSKPCVFVSEWAVSDPALATTFQGAATLLRLGWERSEHFFRASKKMSSTIRCALKTTWG